MKLTDATIRREEPRAPPLRSIQCPKDNSPLYLYLGAASAQCDFSCLHIIGLWQMSYQTSGRSLRRLPPGPSLLVAQDPKFNKK